MWTVVNVGGWGGSTRVWGGGRPGWRLSGDFLSVWPKGTFHLQRGVECWGSSWGGWMDVTVKLLNRAGRGAEKRCNDDVTAPDSVISGVKDQPEVLLVWLQGLRKHG